MDPRKRPYSSSRGDHNRRDPLQAFSTYTPKKHRKSVKKMNADNEILVGSVIGILLFFALGLYGMYQLELIDWFMRLIG